MNQLACEQKKKHHVFWGSGQTSIARVRPLEAVAQNPKVDRLLAFLSDTRGSSRIKSDMCHNETMRLPGTAGSDKDVLITTHSHQFFQDVLRHQPKPVSDQPFQCGVGAPSSSLLKHQVAIITQPVARGSVKQSCMAANSLECKVVFTRVCKDQSSSRMHRNRVFGRIKRKYIVREIAVLIKHREVVPLHIRAYRPGAASYVLNVCEGIRVCK